MRSVNNQKGSALLLVLMISLVLSAFGLVAMRDIALGVHQSASFRVRTQASSISDAAASAFSMRAGNQASAYVHAIKSTSKRNSGGQAIFGGNDMTKYNYTGAANEFQETLSSHGGFLVFRHDDLSSSNGLIPNQFTGGGTQQGESGLFRGPGTAPGDVSSFEVQNETEFLLVLRDIKDGIPAPGFSERYCFKKATVAAQARVGRRPTPGSDDPATFAIGTHTNDILIGPIECGYN